MFRKSPQAESAPAFTPRLLTHGWALDADGKPADEVLAVFMPGPRTFSGEDVAEIHCHGGLAVTDALLESALARGARLARPGEFTRRAWLNGRLDISQAEAVAEMIAAPTRQGVYLARNKLAGRLGEELAEARQALDELRAALLLALDFPDEAEAEAFAAQRAFIPRLEALAARFAALAQAYERARLWREGALAVLAGKVNVGKSSLLNALLGRRRALVAETPGTTRDYLEEGLNLSGLPVRLADTAGLRPDAESVEAEGMELAHDLFRQADLILLVLDAPAAALEPEDAALMAEYRDKILIILNKNDLRPGESAPEALFGRPALAVSAKCGQGLEELRAQIYRQVTDKSGALDFEAEAAPSLRQRHLLDRARAEVLALAGELEAGLAPELLSLRLDAAAALLEEVMGLSGSEEILDLVFSSFCLGK